jgi:hypothetical protein
MVTQRKPDVLCCSKLINYAAAQVVVLPARQHTDTLNLLTAELNRICFV